MTRNTKWIGVGALSAALIGTVAAGCDKQSSNPDNIVGVPTTAATTTTASPQVTTPSAQVTTASIGSFADVAGTWNRMDTARSELDTAIKAGKLDQVHEASTKIRGLVKTLPEESSNLPEDKRRKLDAHVQNVGELTEMMDKAAAPSDMKSLTEHQTAMNDALDMVKDMYPAGTMHSSMHMPNMNSSSKGMEDSSTVGMSDDDKMTGKPMSDDDKMPNKGIGKPSDPNKMSSMPADKMPDKAVGGMGMMDKMMPGMDKMGDKPMSDDMMDKMTSGMAATDKNEMKMMMDKMAAMPPAERKKAMQKMSGTDKPNAPVNKAAPKDTTMPGSGMSDM